MLVTLIEVLARVLRILTTLCASVLYILVLALAIFFIAFPCLAFFRLSVARRFLQTLSAVAKTLVRCARKLMSCARKVLPLNKLRR